MLDFEEIIKELIQIELDNLKKVIELANDSDRFELIHHEKN